MTAKRQAKTQKPKAAKKPRPNAAKTKVARTAVKEKEPKAKKRRFDVEFYRDWCKGCGICVAFCPAGALSMNDKGDPEITNSELCTGCTWCEMRCPDFAVRVKEEIGEEVCEA